jgi:hypothetical protein
MSKSTSYKEIISSKLPSNKEQLKQPCKDSLFELTVRYFFVDGSFAK